MDGYEDEYVNAIAIVFYHINIRRYSLIPPVPLSQFFNVVHQHTNLHLVVNEKLGMGLGTRLDNNKALARQQI